MEKSLQEWKKKSKGREREKRRGEETEAGRSARKQKQGEMQVFNEEKKNTIISTQAKINF